MPPLYIHLPFQLAAVSALAAPAWQSSASRAFSFAIMPFLSISGSGKCSISCWHNM